MRHPLPTGCSPETPFTYRLPSWDILYLPAGVLRHPGSGPWSIRHTLCDPVPFHRHRSKLKRLTEQKLYIYYFKAFPVRSFILGKVQGKNVPANPWQLQIYQPIESKHCPIVAMTKSFWSIKNDRECVSPLANTIFVQQTNQQAIANRVSASQLAETIIFMALLLHSIWDL